MNYKEWKKRKNNNVIDNLDSNMKYFFNNCGEIIIKFKKYYYHYETKLKTLLNDINSEYLKITNEVFNIHKYDYTTFNTIRKIVENEHNNKFLINLIFENNEDQVELFWKLEQEKFNKIVLFDYNQIFKNFGFQLLVSELHIENDKINKIYNQLRLSNKNNNNVTIEKESFILDDSKQFYLYGINIIWKDNKYLFRHKKYYCDRLKTENEILTAMNIYGTHLNINLIYENGNITCKTMNIDNIGEFLITDGGDINRLINTLLEFDTKYSDDIIEENKSNVIKYEDELIKLKSGYKLDRSEIIAEDYIKKYVYYITKEEGDE